MWDSNRLQCPTVQLAIKKFEAFFASIFFGTFVGFNETKKMYSLFACEIRLLKKCLKSPQNLYVRKVPRKLQKFGGGGGGQTCSEKPIS